MEVTPGGVRKQGFTIQGQKYLKQVAMKSSRVFLGKGKKNIHLGRQERAVQGYKLIEVGQKGVEIMWERVVN